MWSFTRSDSTIYYQTPWQIHWPIVNFDWEEVHQHSYCQLLSSVSAADHQLAADFDLTLWTILSDSVILRRLQSLARILRSMEWVDYQLKFSQLMDQVNSCFPHLNSWSHFSVYLLPQAKITKSFAITVHFIQVAMAPRLVKAVQYYSSLNSLTESEGHGFAPFGNYYQID